MSYNNMNQQQGYPQAYPQGHPQGYSQGFPQQYPQPPNWKAADEEEQPSAQNGVGYIDPEDLETKNMAFNDQTIRKGFIRKVYMILMVQLIITFGFVALFLFHGPTAQFTRKNPAILIAAGVATLVLVIVMACCEGTRRKFPLNFFLLGAFTLCEALLVGAIASRYESSEVLLAVGITAILCLGLSIFAMQTKYDFTVCGGFIVCSMLCLMVFGIIAIFWHNHIVQLVYASIGALLACIYLIYDTQLMMGGAHKYSLSPEEYIFAALTLYLDVIRILIYVLRLVGGKK